MILSDYVARREALEKKMQEIGEREAAHKMELSIKFQTECKKIASQIGNLKHRRAELNKQYQMDKAWCHRRYQSNKQYVRHMYSEEKRNLIDSIHTLRLEYLTVNGLTDVRPSKLTPPLPTGGIIRKEEPNYE